MTRSFVLGRRFEAFIDSQVQAGRYGDANEVVREALGLLEDQERLRHLRLSESHVAELHALTEVGRGSGVSDGDGEVVLGRLETKYSGPVWRAGV